MRTLLKFMVPGHFFDEVVGIFLKKIFGDLGDHINVILALIYLSL